MSAVYIHDCGGTAKPLSPYSPHHAAGMRWIRALRISSKRRRSATHDTAALYKALHQCVYNNGWRCAHDVGTDSQGTPVARDESTLAAAAAAGCQVTIERVDGRAVDAANTLLSVADTNTGRARTCYSSRET